MKALARFLLLLSLLPGLITGTLPLPGQANGMDMVICADGGEELIRIAPDGTPMPVGGDCEQCCLASSPTLALSPDPAGLSHLQSLISAHLEPAGLALVLLPPDWLFPIPRGPPTVV